MSAQVIPQVSTGYEKMVIAAHTKAPGEYCRGARWLVFVVFEDGTWNCIDGPAEMDAACELANVYKRQHHFPCLVSFEDDVPPPPLDVSKKRAWSGGSA